MIHVKLCGVLLSVTHVKHSDPEYAVSYEAGAGAICEIVADGGAAPHLPAGILSPYGDRERALTRMVSPIADVSRRGAGVAASCFLPVTIRGEMSGRTMRGSADEDRLAVSIDAVPSPRCIAPCFT
ncbi:hypothetical protein MesoLj131b_09610 [Mesorhizobium sp. 131-2-5]|nr:hypothetical protein MesoLj131b_09610 [Mesorhizobium sp. 131-2-5]